MVVGSLGFLFDLLYTPDEMLEGLQLRITKRNRFFKTQVEYDLSGQRTRKGESPAETASPGPPISRRIPGSDFFCDANVKRWPSSGFSLHNVPTLVTESSPDKFSYQQHWKRPGRQPFGTKSPGKQTQWPYPYQQAQDIPEKLLLTLRVVLTGIKWSFQLGQVKEADQNSMAKALKA